MVTYQYGNPDADIVLVQPVGEHDMAGVEAEVAEIRRLADKEFCLLAIKVDNWNLDLSPWQAPAVFGNDDFGDGARETLAGILKLCQEEGKSYYLGGYSLAALFSLWAAYQTDTFAGVAAASPSMWFPGFVDYMKGNDIQCSDIYLSLGDKEEKTRNPVMAKVEDCIREGHAWLKEQGANCTLEWNKSGHFREPELRTAKAFAWLLQS
ncbi:esterase [Selenomonas sp. KH1T6]|uniref:esterase n=1 Tax=Selenomonas sp. KH1T6 TaxID=3158784 RepID=UPI0008A7BC78|nr:hypothetical protein SAMN05216583_12317 [Selenomonas ruminantium]